LSHEIEFDDQGAMMVTMARNQRELPWHGLGEVVDHRMSTAEVMKTARLNDWNVRTVSEFGVEFTDPATGLSVVQDIKKKQLVIRDNPVTGKPEVLHIPGKRYQAVQNEEAFSFADHIADDPDAKWETAGSLADGNVVFGSLSLERDVVLDPEGARDVTKTYLLIINSHNGAYSLTAAVTPVRVVCMNTLRMAMGNTEAEYKLRHTKNVDGRIAEAQEALRHARYFMDRFEVDMRALYEVRATEIDFDRLYGTIYPFPEDKGKAAKTMYGNKRDAILEIYNGPTCATIRGTMYGVLNAHTEYLDWNRRTKGKDDRKLYEAAAGFNPVVLDQKQTILNVIREYAEV
jgi:phage/plasmid-like protein (TIGR03299 family)